VGYEACDACAWLKRAVDDAAGPASASNGSTSSDEDSRESELLVFSRLPGLSSDVINDVFRQLPASASVSVSADAVHAGYLL